MFSLFHLYSFLFFSNKNHWFGLFFIHIPLSMCMCLCVHLDNSGGVETEQGRRWAQHGDINIACVAIDANLVLLGRP